MDLFFYVTNALVRFDHEKSTLNDLIPLCESMEKEKKLRRSGCQRKERRSEQEATAHA